MNSVLTVVKSFDSDSIQSFTTGLGFSSESQQQSRSSKSSQSGFFFKRRRKKSTSKSVDANSFNTSNALIDDTCLQNAYNEKNTTKNRKERRSGDLPPMAKKRPSFTGSMGIAVGASDNGIEEDVVSVFSTLSDLSLESVGHRASQKSGPIVITDASLQREARIPDVLCLKSKIETKIKMSRMIKLKRKISFKKASF